MKINFDFRSIKDVLINFLNSANTPSQVYLRFLILSMIVIVPSVLITINRIYSYSSHKKMAIKEDNDIKTNRAKIMDLATIATEVLEHDKVAEQKDINFLTDLGKIVENTNNEITNFKPLPKRVVTVGENNIESFPVDLRLVGSFSTLINFLEQIKKYDRICVVEKMDIKMSGLNYPYIESSLTVVLFQLVKEVEEIGEIALKIQNDPFKPFNYEGEDVSMARKTGDVILTGIVREKQMIWAIIEIGGKGYIVKKGDNIGEDIKITNISSDSVYLIKKENAIRLKLKGK